MKHRRDELVPKGNYIYFYHLKKSRKFYKFSLANFPQEKL